jgi:hypothetical protein
MARARSIKPGFFRNADLTDVPFEGRLLFIGLWTMADRAGRMEDRPKQIKMELFPADDVDCDLLLDLLASIGMIERYNVNGTKYLQVNNFSKHQNPHKDEKASIIPLKTVPAPCELGTSTVPAPCKVGTSTVQAPCEPSASMVAILLTPDSLLLTPDSLLLTPDSLLLNPDCPPLAPAIPTARGSRMPKDFEPDLDFAAEQGINNVIEEVAKFTDYWSAAPGQKGIKLDWQATWRNWCRNAQKATSAPKTFAQINAAMAGVTVPSNGAAEATKSRLDADAAIPRNGPSLADLAKMAALRGRVAA